MVELFQSALCNVAVTNGHEGVRCEDCGLILQVIAGKDAKDPGTAGKSFYYTPQYARPIKELKIGYAPVDFADGNGITISGNSFYQTASRA